MAQYPPYQTPQWTAYVLFRRLLVVQTDGLSLDEIVHQTQQLLKVRPSIVAFYDTN